MFGTTGVEASNILGDQLTEIFKNNVKCTFGATGVEKFNITGIHQTQLIGRI